MAVERPMRRECAATFAKMETALDGLHDDVKAIREAVVGNGDPAGSLVARVAALEARRSGERQAADRAWRVVAVVAAVLCAMSALSGAVVALTK